MDKNQKILIALPFLLAAVVLVFLPWFNKKSSTSAKEDAILTVGPANNENPGEVSPIKKEILSLIADANDSHDIFMDAEWGKRNPFDKSKLVNIPVAADPAPPINLDSLRLEGTLMSKPKPSAIINDTVVGVGSEIEGFKVKSISDTEVVVSDGKSDFTIKLRAPSSDKSSDNATGPAPEQAALSPMPEPDQQ